MTDAREESHKVASVTRHGRCRAAGPQGFRASGPQGMTSAGRSRACKQRRAHPPPLIASASTVGPGLDCLLQRCNRRVRGAVRRQRSRRLSRRDSDDAGRASRPTERLLAGDRRLRAVCATVTGAGHFCGEDGEDGEDVGANFKRVMSVMEGPTLSPFLSVYNCPLAFWWGVLNLSR